MTRKITVVSALAILLTVSGCAGGIPEAADETNKPEVALPSEEDISEFISVDCPDILTAGVAKVLQDGGWTSETTSPWTIGDTSLDTGLLCDWVAGEGEPMSYGWAEAAPEEVLSISVWLEESGWRTETLVGESLHSAPDSSATYVISDAGEIWYSSSAEGIQAVQPPA